MIKRSILASIFIGFGVAVLLTLGNPLGPVLFAFGLLSVCIMQANLFTGKAGYYWKDKKLELLAILGINLVAGWAFGFLLSVANPDLVGVALTKMATWSWSLDFIIKSYFCGMVMYICVELYKRGTAFGIFLGIPLFIFCGFQHSIANAIICGVARDFSSTLFLCAAANLLGSVTIDVLNGE